MKENKEDRFRESIENIEPEAGAKERMLENIRRKAELQEKELFTPQKTEKKGNPFYKKIVKIALPVAACFMIAIIGILKIVPMFGGISTEPGFVQTPASIVAVDSAKDFEELGIAIDAPEDSDTVSYAIIDGKIAEICFTLDNHRYFVRASKQSGDFSGVNGNLVTSDKFDSETDATLDILKSGDTTFYKLSWTDGETNFILASTDGASAESMRSVYQKIK